MVKSLICSYPEAGVYVCTVGIVLVGEACFGRHMTSDLVERTEKIELGQWPVVRPVRQWFLFRALLF